MERNIYCIPILFLAFSCKPSDNKKVAFSTFPKEIVFTKEVLNLEETILSKMPSIYVVNNNILVYDIYSPDTLIKVFDKFTLNKVGSLGLKGGGPEEITSPGFIATKDNSIWIFDNGKGRLAKYDLSKLSDSEILAAVAYVKKPIQIPFIIFYEVLSEQEFILQSYQESKALLMKYDAANDSIRSFGMNYINDDPIKLSDYHDQYYFTFCKHPDLEKYACAYAIYDVFKIVDGDGEVIKELTGPDQFSLKNTNVVKQAYRHISGSSNYIYCQYVGDVSIIAETQSVRFAKKLHVFDWSANPVAALHFKEPITSFALDLEEDRIIVYTESDELVSYAFDENSL